MSMTQVGHKVDLKIEPNISALKYSKTIRALLYIWVEMCSYIITIFVQPFFAKRTWIQLCIGSCLTTKTPAIPRFLCPRSCFKLCIYVGLTSESPNNVHLKPHHRSCTAQITAMSCNLRLLTSIEIMAHLDTAEEIKEEIVSFQRQVHQFRATWWQIYKDTCYIMMHPFEKEYTKGQPTWAYL